MTPTQRLEQLTTCCPHLARNLALLSPEQLAELLAETKDDGGD